MQKHRNINRQIAGLITVVIFVTLAFCCIVNTCFLGDFYLFQKQLDMKSIYKEIDNSLLSGTLYTDEGYQRISYLSQEYTTSILIADSEGNVICSFGADSDVLVNQMHYSLLSQKNDISVVKENDFYDIKTLTFFNDKVKHLILIGSLSDSNTIFFSCPTSEINHASAISNKFLIIIMIIAVIVAGFVSYAMIGKMTKPLFNLIDITKQISNFDFSYKYRPQKIYNELDDLGEHINEMSSTLERAIDQLKRANDNLKKDLEIQEEAENMRKEFISNVSHELKTPIALIQGYAEGLQEGVMDDEISRNIYLDVIIDEAGKMNRLVREMLILNQLEAGQMDADLCDFDVTSILDGIIESNQIYFEAQSIDFSFINKEKCFVKADEFLVEQVFTNFMSNAIHYVQNENIIIVKYEFVKKGKVRISVFNSGNNIPKKDIKHIWEKFYKVDKARSREYGGSGIGLSVVKATMELLHEKYGVENLSNGVEFWFELSLSKDTKNKQNT